MYLIIFVALFLQMTVLNYVKIFGSKPDLALIAVIFFGLFLGEGGGLESGIMAGLLKDVLALDFFGINAFILGLTGFIVGFLNTKFFKESKITEFVIVFSFTAFSMSIHFALVSVFSKSLVLNFFEYLTTSVMPTSIYTSLVAIPIFSKFIEIYNLKESEELP